MPKFSTGDKVVVKRRKDFVCTVSRFVPGTSFYEVELPGEHRGLKGAPIVRAFQESDLELSEKAPAG